MKFLVVSDTHGSTEALSSILERHPGLDVYHCGDFCYPRAQFPGFTYVHGNCDFDPATPAETVLNVGSLRIFQTHGHTYGVKEALTRLHYRAAELGANLALFGHTHVPAALLNEGILLLNPGSLLLPRLYPVPTYVVVETEDEPAEGEDEISLHVTFYSSAGERQEKLGGSYHVRRV
ncbi:YfcE family phosphodiesterase [Aneurinibacillus tyrosinisolvens]|uniref:YfcE family phosphodiesterase n=1 Tax=Aneurinibacillus tyrosinisolvens TaxID=1443435 RepID=UPI00063FAFD1|nr:YfcE family phosphodiesterase [Aneurinibacillus tyrosinisolvens]